jgi:hypothetical protein
LTVLSVSDGRCVGELVMISPKSARLRNGDHAAGASTTDTRCVSTRSHRLHPASWPVTVAFTSCDTNPGALTRIV